MLLRPVGLFLMCCLSQLAAVELRFDQLPAGHPADAAQLVYPVTVDGIDLEVAISTSPLVEWQFRETSTGQALGLQSSDSGIYTNWIDANRAGETAEFISVSFHRRGRPVTVDFGPGGVQLAMGGGSWVLDAATTGSEPTLLADATGVTGFTLAAEDDGDASSSDHFALLAMDIESLSDTPAAAPLPMSAQAVSHEQINLSWDAVDGAGSYLITRKHDDSAHRVTAILVSAWDTENPQYVDRGLLPSTSYRYGISALAEAWSPGMSLPEAPELQSLSATTVTLGDAQESRETDGLPHDEAELPLTESVVDAFHMARYEISNADYAAFLNWALDPMGDGSMSFITVADAGWWQTVMLAPRDPRDGSLWQVQPLLHVGHSDCDISWDGTTFSAGSRAEHPVVCISWYGALFYCWARNAADPQLSQGIDLYDWSIDNTVAGWRLPTAAQWERAARADLPAARFPWGDAVDPSRANSRGSGDAAESDTYPMTQATGSYAANALGLYDMAGNVWEWCQDSDDALRQIRGGGWDSHVVDLRCAARAWAPAADGFNGIGFRPVLIP